MALTLDAALKKTGNNLDLVRLAAAILVISSHSYPLLGRSDEIYSALFRYTTGGGFAVSAFFVISGFLIARSAQENDGRSFMIARFLRLGPALLFVALIQFFVIGPIFSTLPLHDYLRLEWNHVPTTVTLYASRSVLAGTFADNPVKAINGSLWTLNYEWAFYMIIFVLISLKILRKETASFLFLTVLAILYYIKIGLGFNFGNSGGMLFLQSPFYSGVENFCFFLIGGLFYFHREEIQLSWSLAITSLIILFFSKESLFSTFAFQVCYPYLIMFVGLGIKPPFNIKKHVGDLSYGVYLFGFPVQQIWIALMPSGLTPTRLTLLATAASLACAWVCWHAVEAPALRLRHRWGGR